MLGALVLAAGCENSPSGSDGSANLAGSWVAVNTGNKLWGDSIRVVLTQTDTLLTGTYTVWGATAGSNRPATYSGEAAGIVSETRTAWGLTYDPRAYGCTGAERSCFQTSLVFWGETTGVSVSGTFEDGSNHWSGTFEKRR